MKKNESHPTKNLWCLVLLQGFSFFLLSTLLAPAIYAQASPWENAINLLQTSFTGPLARGLSLIAIVIGGIMFAYSEGGSKKVFAGIIFGLGMALGAVNFMTWLFGVA